MKTTPTPFGHSYDTGIKSELMLVIVNDGHGRMPVQILLPHQLYRERVEKDWPNAIVEVVPIRRDEIRLVRKPRSAR